MERRANYVLVGALSIVLLLGALVFIVWLAEFQFNQTWDSYRVILKGPVSGLSKGGEVQFNGIKVGEITEISLDPADPNRVITDIEIAHKTPVREDSMAQTGSQGITGVKYIQISPGNVAKPLMRPGSRRHPAIIHSAPSRMESFVQDLSQLASDGAQALGRINKLLSDDNLQSVSRTLSDINSITGAINSRKDMLNRLDTTFAKIDGAAGDLQKTAALVRLELGSNGTLDNIAGAVAELRSAIGDARKTMVAVNLPAAQLSTTTIPRLNQALESIQQAADSLDKLTVELNQDPGALIARSKGRQVEIPK